MERHYRNVGLIAVAMAQLEEVAAYVVYASKGGWDNSDEHLRLMARSWELREKLGQVVDGLPGDVATTHVDPTDWSTTTKHGELRRRVGNFDKELQALTDERNRIVHSVVGQRIWDSEPQAVHPRALSAGDGHARRPLPSDDEIAHLVSRIDYMIREGRSLEGQVAAMFDRGEPA